MHHHQGLLLLQLQHLLLQDQHLLPVHPGSMNLMSLTVKPLSADNSAFKEYGYTQTAVSSSSKSDNAITSSGLRNPPHFLF